MKQTNYEKEIELEEGVIGSSNISLILTKTLKDKIDYLSTEYTKTEIAGFLTYKEITQDADGNVKIVLDNLLIPLQKARSSEVDIHGDGLIGLYKEYGTEAVSKIIGHWHSHQTMGVFFSSTDEEMMKSYCEHKDFRIFIVSSEGQHLIRMVLKNNLFEMNIENVEYAVETDNTIKILMEEEIKNKLIIPVITTYSYTSSTNETKKIKKEIQARIKYLQHQNHKVRIEKIRKCYADLILSEFKTLNPISEEVESDKTHFNVIVELGDRNKAKEFMCNVKEFLLKTLMSETDTTREVVNGELEDTLTAEEMSQFLDEEEVDEMELNNYKGSWNNYIRSHSNPHELNYEF
jgi:hypothetical protein